MKRKSSVLNKLRGFCKRVRRSWDYAVLGWSNYDFDYGYLLAVLRFKLERMHKFLSGPDAIATHDKPALQSLRLAARLAKKLETDEYIFFVDRHNEKWKHVPTHEHIEPTPDERKAGIGMISRPIRTPETAAARTEYIRAVEDDQKIRARDLRWLFSIIEEYHTRWWD
jgi:hypothetical protein